MIMKMKNEKRHNVMVKFTDDEFKFIQRYQEWCYNEKLKLINRLKLNTHAIKPTDGDTVRLIIKEFILLTGKN
jgi:hypothetical protein